jgi:photosystem II stability/assembly factor-like uncharacterized protein
MVLKILLSFFLVVSALISATSQPKWTKLTTDPFRGKQDDIYFTDEKNGWYVNGAGKIYNTKDAGATWTLQLEKKGTFFRCIAFIDTLTGFAGTVGTNYFPNVTDTIPLYKTTDGGKTWQVCPYKGNYVKGLCAIDIVKEQIVNHGEIGYRHHVYAVGRVGTPANILVSHDDGNTFESSDLSKYGTMFFDIKMFDKNEGFACTASSAKMNDNHGRIIYTKDGGKTWKTVYESKRPFEITWKCSFPTRKIGYVTLQSYNPDSSVAEQHIVKTTNGGKKWKEEVLCIDHKARPFGVGFIDEKTGFVGTANSGYQTVDGGKTWQKINLGYATNKIRISKNRAGRLYGYAIGVNVFKLAAEESVSKTD